MLHQAWGGVTMAARERSYPALTGRRVDRDALDEWGSGLRNLTTKPHVVFAATQMVRGNWSGAYSSCFAPGASVAGFHTSTTTTAQTMMTALMAAATVWSPAGEAVTKFRLACPTATMSRLPCVPL